MATLPQFYFTKLDPDYSVKGSRDPLGFQVLWQHQARKLLPYLSTVSGNIHDFQVMCLAYHLYGKQPDNRFVKFFLRFEQLMAYVRFSSGEKGLNGINRVRAKVNSSDRLSISNSPNDEILSNQRAYGIWGKYNRPFQEIGFLTDSRFAHVFAAKVASLPDRTHFDRVFKQVLEKDSVRLHMDELSPLHPLLQLTREERAFYKDKILKVQTANPYQNQLFAYLYSTALPEVLELYPFLHTFKASPQAQSEDLQLIIQEIEGTERLLAPLNRAFRFLQTRPLWSRDDIESATYLQQCKETSLCIFMSTTEENKTKNELALSLQKDNWAMVEDLVKRNTEVSAWRGGAPWLTISSNVLEVHHSDGGFYHPEFNPLSDVDNYYFINTYINLFWQLNKR
jgi:hypothetical protein